METKELHKDIQNLMKKNKDLTSYHSGGGCEHLAYKVLIINDPTYHNGELIDFDYEIQNINFKTKLSFGDYQNDINYFFESTLEEGMKLIDKYNMKGEQY